MSIATAWRYPPVCIKGMFWRSAMPHCAAIHCSVYRPSLITGLLRGMRRLPDAPGGFVTSGPRARRVQQGAWGSCCHRAGYGRSRRGASALQVVVSRRAACTASAHGQGKARR